MESVPKPQLLTFESLRVRLLAELRRRLLDGEFTERGLARVVQISQSQLHNVLKGARTLQPGLADIIMRRFGISLSALLTDWELDFEFRRRNLGVGARIDDNSLPAEVHPLRKPADRVSWPRNLKRTG